MLETGSFWLRVSPCLLYNHYNIFSFVSMKIMWLLPWATIYVAKWLCELEIFFSQSAILRTFNNLNLEQINSRTAFIYLWMVLKYMY